MPSPGLNVQRISGSSSHESRHGNRMMHVKTDIRAFCPDRPIAPVLPLGGINKYSSRVMSMARTACHTHGSEDNRAHHSKEDRARGSVSDGIPCDWSNGIGVPCHAPRSRRNFDCLSLVTVEPVSFTQAAPPLDNTLALNRIPVGSPCLLLLVST